MNTTKRPILANPVSVFLVTWLGQLLSLVGSGLTSFAIGITVYRQSGSITQFSFYYALTFLPALLLTPLAGALVDRWDRRRVMLLSDLGAGGCSVLILGLVLGGDAQLWQVQSWHFYPLIVLGAGFNTFRWPAYFAATTMLVPKRHLGRANGLIDLASGVGQVASPVLAAGLMGSIGLRGILFIDVVSFVLATGTLLLVRFPAPSTSEEGQQGRGSLLAEMRVGWAFIRRRPGLVWLTGFVAVVNLVLGMVITLIAPLVLSFADVSTLGAVQSMAGIGMLAGAALMSAWGGPRQRLLGVLGAQALAGLALIIGSLRPSVPLVTASAALFLFCVPPIWSSAQALWQTKVAPDLQGRVFAVRRMVVLAVPPVAALLAGVLAERVFEPALAPEGALAGTVGRLLGTGPGRGIAFLFSLLGLLCLGNALAAWMSPRLRWLERELPDVLADQPPQAVPAAPAVPEAGLGTG